MLEGEATRTPASAGCRGAAPARASSCAAGPGAAGWCRCTVDTSRSSASSSRSSSIASTSARCGRRWPTGWPADAAGASRRSAAPARRWWRRGTAADGNAFAAQLVEQRQQVRQRARRCARRPRSRRGGRCCCCSRRRKSRSSSGGRLSTQKKPASSSACSATDLPEPEMPVTSTTSRRGLRRRRCGDVRRSVRAHAAPLRGARLRARGEHLLRMRQAGPRQPLAAEHARDLGDARLAGDGCDGAARAWPSPRLLGDDEVVVGAGGHLRQVGHGQHLAVAAELLHQAAHRVGHGAADAGIDLVEDQRRRRLGAAAELARGHRDGQRDARQLAAGGHLASGRGVLPAWPATRNSADSRPNDCGCVLRLAAPPRSGRRPCRAAASPASPPRPACGAAARARASRRAWLRAS